MSFCKVKQVGNAALHWAQKHPTLVSTVVSIGVGVGCGAAIGWTGVGAVACGALAGAVGSAVSYGLECSAAGDCNAGDLAKQTVVGAVTGAIGGAIGGGAAGRLLGAAGKRIAAKALSRGAEDIAQDAAETVGGKAASEAADSAGDEAGAGACSIHSFTGDTPVLMSDGSSQPIDTLKVGDQVADSKPDGHGTEKHRVDRVIVTHTDHDFVDLTITTKTAQPRSMPAGVAGPVAPATAHTTATLTTTTHHPFWDATTHTWTQAASLHPGDTLQTPTGRAQIVALRLYTATHTTYDLTIHHLHTYYVEAGTTPVLVHNCGEADDWQIEDHVIPRHTPDGSESAGRATFSKDFSSPAALSKLASQSRRFVGTVQQSTGRARWIIDAGETIGSNRDKSPTSIYTIVRQATKEWDMGDLVTMHPGLPKDLQ